MGQVIVFIIIVVIAMIKAGIFKKTKDAKDEKEYEDRPELTSFSGMSSKTANQVSYKIHTQLSNNRSNGNSVNTTGAYRGSASNTTGAYQGSASNTTGAYQGSASNATGAYRSSITNTASNSGGRIKTTTEASKSTAATAKPADTKKLSTTEYLRQKAEADHREHLKEKQEEMKRRTSESTIPYALRYTGFETVSPQNKIFKCQYCGAENMVPKIYRGRYRCYFCREELKLNQ